MFSRVEKLLAWFDSVVPVGTPKRKVLQIVSVILIFEGISVLALFSYFGALLGFLSMMFGLGLMLLLHREVPSSVSLDEPFGLRLLPRIVSFVGGEHVFMLLGAVAIVLVVVFNSSVSSRPDYGDVDTMTIMMGIMLIAYPIMSRKAKVEMSFALFFVGLVFVFLAAPQAVTALTGGTNSSSVGNWYVTYMLAIPFAAALNLFGIPASYVDNVVTIQFQDGTMHSLAISTYCAGLYSFSIFLSAFMSFVLVLERLSNRTLFVVMSLGLIAAYLGNLVRMILIGAIGYYEGIDALLWAHRNIGWIVFLLWSSVFWHLIFRYVVRGVERRREATPESGD